MILSIIIASSLCWFFVFILAVLYSKSNLAADFIAAIPAGNPQEARVAIALMECLRERVVPNLEESQPIQTISTQQQDLVQALQQNSMTESLPQQLTSQQQGQSSISQEQMQQQQIVKLKQLPEKGG
jgi:hypothetical protein